jgi:hypothetical protein
MPVDRSAAAKKAAMTASAAQPGRRQSKPKKRRAAGRKAAVTRNRERSSRKAILWKLDTLARRTIPLSACEGHMPRKALRETPIERIFREVMGRRMPPSVRRILLPKRTAKRR